MGNRWERAKEPRELHNSTMDLLLMTMQKTSPKKSGSEFPSHFFPLGFFVLLSFECVLPDGKILSLLKSSVTVPSGCFSMKRIRVFNTNKIWGELLSGWNPCELPQCEIIKGLKIVTHLLSHLCRWIYYIKKTEGDILLLLLLLFQGVVVICTLLIYKYVFSLCADYILALNSDCDC